MIKQTHGQLVDKITKYLSWQGIKGKRQNFYTSAPILFNLFRLNVLSLYFSK